jgi:glycosyltransferase involved in cell wall biosynthesis
MMKIGFVCESTFHYYVLAPIARHLPEGGTWLIHHHDATRREPVRQFFQAHHLPFLDLSDEADRVQLTEMDVLVTPYYMSEVRNLHPDALHVRANYGLAKEHWNFDAWNFSYDLILAYGVHDGEAFSCYAKTEQVGNPKFDAWFAQPAEPPRAGGRRVLYLPTYGAVSSIHHYWQALTQLPEAFEVSVKLHHGLSPDDFPAGRARVFTGEDDLLTLLSDCDIVVSGYSGAIFDAMLADRKLLLLNRPDHAAVTEQSQSLEFRARDYALQANDPAEIPALLDRLSQDDPFLQTRRAWTEHLFAYRDSDSGKRAAEAIVKMLAEGRSQRHAVQNVIVANLHENERRIQHLQREVFHAYASIDLWKNKAEQFDEGVVAELTARTERLERELGKARQRIGFLEGELNSIYHGLSWRALARLRQVKDRLLPHQSTQRRLYDLGLKGAKVYLNEGAGALFQKARHKFRKQSNQLPILRSKHEAQLTQILKGVAYKGTVIFFPTVDWGWMVQRPHQLIKQFAEKGYLCFFVTAQTRVDRVDGFKAIAPNLYLCSDITLLYGVSRPILLMSNTDHAAHIARFRRPRVIYDFLDALEVTTIGPVNAERIAEHEDLMLRSELVLATARKLFDEAMILRPDTLLVPNGADPAHFAPRDAATPEDLVPICAKGRPIIGYYGAMAEWFDYDLIRRAAEELPDCEFVLLGPDYDGSISQLARRDNIHYLGLKSYEALPAYLQRFDVATIPFKINTITRATSPVKLFEYMAGRKPIVTTAMDEALNYRSVLVGRDHAEFVSQLKHALTLCENADYMGLLDVECAANTWSQRVDSIVAALEAKQEDARDVFIILAGVPIDDSGGGQRPTQIVLELLSRGVRVIYVNRYPKYENKNLGIRLSHPILETCSLEDFDPILYLDVTGGKRLAALVELPHPDFLPVIEAIKAKGGKVAYDLIDDWQTSLGGDWYDKTTEDRIIERSDVLLASAADLQEYLQLQAKRPVELVQNAVNLHLFKREASYPLPEDMVKGEGTILYIGALWGEWFDWEIVQQVALANPLASVVLIGDYHGQCPFPPLPNMHFLGLKAQRSLPAYLTHADVTIIPFKVSKLTQAVSPLKVFEYLAMGKPVVSTTLRELEGLPHVHLAPDNETFVSMIQTAMREEIDDAAIARFIDGNSWRNRVDTILGALERAEGVEAASR